MDIVERVARALCRADLNSDPDKLLTPAPGETRRFAWELYVDDAKAAIRAMLEGLDPVAFVVKHRDGKGPKELSWKGERLTTADRELGWTETPLYDLSALKGTVALV